MTRITAFTTAARELIQVGRFFYQRGWVPATSGNFSVRLPDGDIAMTVSGRHKGELDERDIMRVDASGNSLEPGRRPSAETLLHTALYARDAGIGSVLHTHSVQATVLSQRAAGPLVLTDYEVLKAFPEVDSHEATVTVPVFANDQDIRRLSARVDAWMDEHPATVGYLISGHGFYTWGASVEDARRHVEAFEFLFECEITKRMMR
jgi:methylthioribulose-1-phosphate dehydratase